MLKDIKKHVILKLLMSAATFFIEITIVSS